MIVTGVPTGIRRLSRRMSSLRRRMHPVRHAAREKVRLVRPVDPDRPAVGPVGQHLRPGARPNATGP